MAESSALLDAVVTLFGYAGLAIFVLLIVAILNMRNH